jgi:hypothetical protein
MISAVLSIGTISQGNTHNKIGNFAYHITDIHMSLYEKQTKTPRTYAMHIPVPPCRLNYEPCFVHRKCKNAALDTLQLNNCVAIVLLACP